MRTSLIGTVTVLVMLVAGACGDDDGTEADRLGVGAECTQDDDCLEGQGCLALKGGYCGIEGCDLNEDCPESSVCVAYDNGNTYCFRTCAVKADCNRNRSADFESNCSSSVAFVEAGTQSKVCVPPSSDTTSGGDAATAAEPDAGKNK